MEKPSRVRPVALGVLKAMFPAVLIVGAQQVFNECVCAYLFLSQGEEE